MATGEKKSWTSVGAVVAAIGASICCIGPLLLLSLGISGAWISTLSSFESVRPFFIFLSIIFIGLGYRKLYLLPGECDKDKPCPLSKVEKKQIFIFWIGSILILLLLAFPLYAPYFMD